MAVIEWRPRLKIFASGDRKVYYNQDTQSCGSYNTRVGLVYSGKVVLLTDYNYSRTTNRHMYSLSNFFRNRDYKIIRVPCTVYAHGGLEKYIKQTADKIRDLQTSLARKRASYKIEMINNEISIYKHAIQVMEDLLLSKEIEDQLGGEST